MALSISSAQLITVAIRVRIFRRENSEAFPYYLCVVAAVEMPRNVLSLPEINRTGYNLRETRVIARGETGLSNASKLKVKGMKVLDDNFDL